MDQNQVEFFLPFLAKKIPLVAIVVATSTKSMPLRHHTRFFCLYLLHQELVYGLDDGSYQQNKHPMHLVAGQVHHSSCFGCEMGLKYPFNCFLGSVWGALDVSDVHKNLLR